MRGDPEEMIAIRGVRLEEGKKVAVFVSLEPSYSANLVATYRIATTATTALNQITHHPLLTSTNLLSHRVILQSLQLLIALFASHRFRCLRSFVKLHHLFFA